MNAAIFLRDLIPGGAKLQPVETFTFDIDNGGLNAVKDRLRELQKGYCNPGERIKIGAREEKKILLGKVVKTIYATSEVDFSYVAFLGLKLKKDL